MTEERMTRFGDEPPDAPDGAVPLHHLTTRQRAVVTLINQYEQRNGEPCSASWLARRLRLHHETVRQHLMVLYRKGWLCAPSAPASIRPAVGSTADPAAPQILRDSGPS
jgi:DNA-binding transcriptional ArsR family regulator